MNENSDHEEILPFISSSESEDEGSFHGFDISDVRSLIDEANQVPLYTSTPQPKKKQKTPNLDGELFLGKPEEHTSPTATSDSERDLDLSGELTGSIFYSPPNRKKFKNEESFIAYGSESELEGETFLDYHESTLSDKDESTKPEPDVNNPPPQAEKKLKRGNA